MPSSDVLLSFFLASVAFACIPGPSMFYAAAQTAVLGRRGGWRSAVGFHIAGLGHVTAAAAGASALLHAEPALFLVMRLAGALYLVAMGVRYLLAPAELPDAEAERRRDRGVGGALRDSFLVEILNPKSFVFFFVFLSQFADPGATFPLWMQILVLGLVVNVLFSLTDLVLIELSHALFRSPRKTARRAKAIRRCGGLVLVGLGVKLALEGV